jgi:transposase
VEAGLCLGSGDAPRLRTIGGRNTEAVVQELAKAKRRFGFPADAPVYSCYEAGRDGFWLHRWLTAQGVHNQVVDSASIETNRRRRRAKSDRLDVAKLVSMLRRYHSGENKVWSVVCVPSAADEDRSEGDRGPPAAEACGHSVRRPRRARDTTRQKKKPRRGLTSAPSYKEPYR